MSGTSITLGSGLRGATRIGYWHLFGVVYVSVPVMNEAGQTDPGRLVPRQNQGQLLLHEMFNVIFHDKLSATEISKWGVAAIDAFLKNWSSPLYVYQLEIAGLDGLSFSYLPVETKLEVVQRLERSRIVEKVKPFSVGRWPYIPPSSPDFKLGKDLKNNEVVLKDLIKEDMDFYKILIAFARMEEYAQVKGREIEAPLPPSYQTHLNLLETYLSLDEMRELYRTGKIKDIWRLLRMTAKTKNASFKTAEEYLTTLALEFCETHVRSPRTCSPSAILQTIYSQLSSATDFTPPGTQKFRVEPKGHIRKGHCAWVGARFNFYVMATGETQPAGNLYQVEGLAKYVTACVNAPDNVFEENVFQINRDGTRVKVPISVIGWGSSAEVDRLKIKPGFLLVQ